MLLECKFSERITTKECATITTRTHFSEFALGLSQIMRYTAKVAENRTVSSVLSHHRSLKLAEKCQEWLFWSLLSKLVKSDSRLRFAVKYIGRTKKVASFSLLFGYI